MPQLNPTPWFTVLTLTWLSIFMLLPKVLGHLYLNPLAPRSPACSKQWIWPWL